MNQLYFYLDRTILFYEHQPGFQFIHLVSTALMVSTNNLCQKIDKGNYTSLILIDLKKGFNTVDLEIPFKMQMYRVTCVEHDIIE